MDVTAWEKIPDFTGSRRQSTKGKPASRKIPSQKKYLFKKKLPGNKILLEISAMKIVF